ncbi:O-methyltransferase [Cytophaga hutchinsonii]|uniref:O-methyltransferase n=1 Tax=Cytophaga hutchinsonii (strain ATCC 33406 / DSM 1761 / CIP 103989 / NBRC 15051 / NCIMB 9469 / D465) TaxID=269798 RepID=A0A6N4SVJ0_CYTH3|nr:O-methyltransferase [Cytophaga hutchinsonii]ABG60272.1 O-methyltransferase [Cytophaga hutchinsonii ATCC 33406]SFX20252.1 Predicted O-methyltransferase YrrM [Cytophaga hutchinsonii ATCC 33406]
MIDITNPLIEEYIRAHSTIESDLLKKVNRETYAEVLMPRMLSGHYQGRVLSMLAHMIRPKRILEIGTFTGYSALCLSEGLPAGAELITIDINEELEDRVRAYFMESEKAKAITYLIGDAMKVTESLEGLFDLVFIDADKHNYLNYYHLVFDKVPAGGFIMVDNTLWNGKVAIPEVVAKDKDTRNLHSFNAFIAQDARIEKIILPVRDGITIIRKK